MHLLRKFQDENVFPLSINFQLDMFSFAKHVSQSFAFAFTILKYERLVFNNSGLSILQTFLHFE